MTDHPPTPRSDGLLPGTVTADDYAEEIERQLVETSERFGEPVYMHPRQWKRIAAMLRRPSPPPPQGASVRCRRCGDSYAIEFQYGSLPQPAPAPLPETRIGYGLHMNHATPEQRWTRARVLELLEPPYGFDSPEIADAIRAFAALLPEEG